MIRTWLRGRLCNNYSKGPDGIVLRHVQGSTLVMGSQTPIQSRQPPNQVAKSPSTPKLARSQANMRLPAEEASAIFHLLDIRRSLHLQKSPKTLNPKPKLLNPKTLNS